MKMNMIISKSKRIETQTVIAIKKLYIPATSFKKSPSCSLPRMLANTEEKSKTNFVENKLINIGRMIDRRINTPIIPIEFFITENPDIIVRIDSPSGPPTIGMKLPANLIVLAASPSDAIDKFVLNNK